MSEPFEQTILSHLDAAYNLARWLVRSPADADDVVQESCLRALRFYDGFRGGDSRAWFLKIVRNTCYSWLRKTRPAELSEEFDEMVHSTGATWDDPETELLSQADAARVRQALEALPVAFREVLVLREIEGLSYKEISNAIGAPIGTVMSGLSRARRKLRDQLAVGAGKGV